MRICLYGAGSKNIKPTYIEEGYKLGEEIAKRGHLLVFGGGSNGIMGSVSKGVVEHGGSTLGIAPSWIDAFEELKSDCSEFIYTKSMDERKNLFLENSDAFIIAPGGIGTLDEFFEIINLKALGQHNKKIVILNHNNFYAKLNEMFQYLKEEGVIRRDLKTLFSVKNTAEEALDYLENENEE